MNYKNTQQILNCNHQWKKSLLLYTTVEDCCKCNVRREDWESILCKEVIQKPEKATPFELYTKHVMDEMLDSVSKRLLETDLHNYD